MIAQIQGLEDMLGSHQGAVDGVPAEPSAGVPHASQTYMRIIAKARNEAGLLQLKGGRTWHLSSFHELDPACCRCAATLHAQLPARRVAAVLPMRSHVCSELR